MKNIFKILGIIYFICLTGCATLDSNPNNLQNPSAKDLMPLAKKTLANRLIDMNENLKVGVQKKIDSGEFFTELQQNISDGINKEVITTTYQKQIVVDKAVDKTIQNVEEIVPVITLPPLKKSDISRSVFTNTQKTVVKDPKTGFTFDIYYGSGGRYLVVTHPPEELYVEPNKAEGILTVDRHGSNPETLSLAIDKNGVLSGAGISREGTVGIDLELTYPASQYHDLIEVTISFDIKVKSL